LSRFEGLLAKHGAPIALHRGIVCREEFFGFFR
jgi:hypothetical protein